MPELIELRVCSNCLQHSANGECGGCHEDHEGYEPDGSLIPGDDEYGYSTWPCEACGSSFHGDRYQAWEDRDRA